MSTYTKAEIRIKIQKLEALLTDVCDTPAWDHVIDAINALKRELYADCPSALARLKL